MPTEARFLRYTLPCSVVNAKSAPKANDETAASANVAEPISVLGEPHRRIFRRIVVPARRKGPHSEAPDENRS